MAQDDTSKKLAAAKKALADTHKHFGDNPDLAPAKPAAPAAPKPKAPSAGMISEQEGGELGQSLKAKAENVKAVAEAPKMHDGGKVKKDGIHNLQKGEVVIPKDKAKEGEAVLALKKKAGAMSQAIDEDEAEKQESKPKKEGGKKTADKQHAGSEKKEKESKKKQVKGMHIRRATSGGFIAKHDMDKTAEPGMDQEEHALPDMGAVQQHISDHMGGEMGAEGGDQGGSPAGM